MSNPPRPSRSKPHAVPEARSTRERLLSAMAFGMRRQGLHGVGIAALLAEAGAPKGVLYHHFPGGKAELAAASVDATAEQLVSLLDAMIVARPEPRAMVRAWFDAAGRHLARSGFEQGCPLATVGLETTADDHVVRAALGRAFATMRDRLVACFVAAGQKPADARATAALVLSAYEGALLQARLAGSLKPLSDTADALLAALPDS